MVREKVEDSKVKFKIGGETIVAGPGSVPSKGRSSIKGITKALEEIVKYKIFETDFDAYSEYPAVCR